MHYHRWAISELDRINLFIAGNDVRFEKHYETHTIVYSGSLVGKHITGTWHQLGLPPTVYGGDFDMQPTDDGPQLR